MEWGKARRGGKNTYGYRLDLNLPSSHLSLTRSSCCAVLGVCKGRWRVQDRMGGRAGAWVEGIYGLTRGASGPSNNAKRTVACLPSPSVSFDSLPEQSRARSPVRPFPLCTRFSAFFFLPRPSMPLALPPSPSLLFLLPSASSSSFPPSLYPSPPLFIGFSHPLFSFLFRPLVFVPRCIP